MRARRERPVVLTCDANYQPAAMVCLTSAFLNCGDVEFTTYIVTDEVSERFASAVRALGGTFGRDVRIARMGAEQARRVIATLGSTQLPPHLTDAAFWRLVVPELLPHDSFLYLDCDLIVQASLDHLLRLDVGRHVVAAVPEQAQAEWGRRNLRLPADASYFNSGVMILDARNWRAAGGFLRAAEICRANGPRIVTADQDVLNLMLSERGCRHLDPEWNTLQQDLMLSGRIDAFDIDAFRGIYHFNTEFKPWLGWAPVRSRQLYDRYAAVAPMRMAEVTTPRNARERQAAAMAERRARIVAAHAVRAH